MSGTARIALLGAGGTIDRVGSSRLDLAWYFETGERLAAGELLAAVRELPEVASVDEVDFPRPRSDSWSTEDWLRLARSIGSLLEDDGYDGVVVTHGTNTMEETACFLHLTVCSPKPVVLVGAMRPSSALGADGYLNMLRAVQVAAAEQARGHGVLVVMNDTIHAARDVTKSATYRTDALRAGDLGPLGFADADGRVVFYHRHVAVPAHQPPFDVGRIDALPRVDVVVSYVGADATLIDAAVDAGAQGIVSAGAGAGRPTPAEIEGIDRAVARGVVVCQCSRVGSGRVALSPAQVRRGLVAGDNLQPWKAKVLLSLALTRTTDPAEIQRLFDTL